MDEFDFSPDIAAQPLDVGSFGGTPPFVSPKQQSAKPNFKDYAPLLALLPVVAQRGGMQGIAALMKGMQDARAAKQQQGRQGMLDDQAAARQQSQANYQQGQLDNQALQRRQQFMGQFGTALGNVDDPAAVKALIDFYGGQAQDFGVERPALEQFAMQTATPDRLMNRKVSKRWEKMGVEARQLAQQTKASLQIDGQTIPYDTWAPLVGGMVDPTTGAYPQEAPKPLKPEAPPAAGSFEEYVNLPPDKQAVRRQQRKEFQQADDRPQPQATVLIQTVDETGKPVQRFVNKQPGSEFAVAPTASQQTAMAEQETGMAMMGDIERLFRPEFVGPVAGRAARAQMAIPGAPDVPQEVAQFHASVAGLRNEIIKMFSGAAVSGSEEARMRAQLPDVTDKPSVFQAKLNQTRRNREMLLQRTQARSGGSPAPITPMPSHGQTGKPVKIGRFEVTVEP